MFKKRLEQEVHSGKEQEGIFKFTYEFHDSAEGRDLISGFCAWLLMTAGRKEFLCSILIHYPKERLLKFTT